MRTFFIIITLFFLSCDNGSSRSDSISEDTIQQPKDTSITTTGNLYDTSRNSGTSLCPWLVDFDSKTKKKNPKFRREYLDVDTIIEGLNELYPNIKLEKVKTSGDTLLTEIKDSEYLGERMGTTGAASYLATAIINLTSLRSIEYVKIDFAEGSHASPGIWSIKDFSDYKEID